MMHRMKKLREVHSEISGTFVWEKTPQGLKYWEEVRDNLEKVITLCELTPEDNLDTKNFFEEVTTQTEHHINPEDTKILLEKDFVRQIETSITQGFLWEDSPIGAEQWCNIVTTLKRKLGD